MLTEFRVTNHRSIRDEQTLSLVPAYDKSRPAVPVAALFGANAAGKSTVLDALHFLQTAVVDSFGRWDAAGGVPRTPFRLDGASRAPSGYLVDLLLDGVRHQYGVELDGDRVLEEWLHSYPAKRRRVIFERHGDTFRTGASSARMRGAIDVLAGLTRPNALFLSVAARSAVEEVGPVYTWFAQQLRVVDPRHVGEGTEHLRDALRDPHRRDAVVALLRAADLGLVDVRVPDRKDRGDFLALVDGDPEVRAARAELALVAGSGEDPAAVRGRLQEAMTRAQAAAYTILEAGVPVFFHGREAVPMAAGDQSRGTLAWADLVVPALATLRDGGLLLVDEIDASLHPTLTAKLVGLFRDQASNPAAAQLVFTTHDTTLLGTFLGDDILGRDEIWFVEKDEAGATSLYCLAEFRPRLGENRERRYLTGTYGAIPQLDNYRHVDAIRRPPDLGGAHASA
jgi:hypothetical protein